VAEILCVSLGMLVLVLVGAMFYTLHVVDRRAKKRADDVLDALGGLKEAIATAGALRTLPTAAPRNALVPSEPPRSPGGEAFGGAAHGAAEAVPSSRERGVAPTIGVEGGEENVFLDREIAARVAELSQARGEAIGDLLREVIARGLDAADRGEPMERPSESPSLPPVTPTEPSAGPQPPRK
jgi:hypothetical protein